MSNEDRTIYFMAGSRVVMIGQPGGSPRITTWGELLQNELADVVSAVVTPVVKTPGSLGVAIRDGQGQTLTILPLACASLLAHLLSQPKPNVAAIVETDWRLLIDTREDYKTGKGD